MKQIDQTFAIRILEEIENKPAKQIEGENFSVVTAFIPDKDPDNPTIRLPISWTYVLGEVSRPFRYNLHLFGDATTDPIKPYFIDMVEHKAIPR